MLLTYKIRHNRDFTEELVKARKVAEYAISHGYCTSKEVKHVGLKSAISNQILKKYGHQSRCKEIHSIKLTIPGQSIVRKNNVYKITPLKLFFDIIIDKKIIKINQAEVDNNYIYVTITVEDEALIQTTDYIGVDLNTSKHMVVVGDPQTGKVWKMGKECEHIRKKYKNIRKNAHKKNKCKSLKNIRHRERNKIKNINHEISKRVVQIAKENNCGIAMENLKGIRERTNKQRKGKNLNYTLNSWAFHELRQFIEYKAHLLGVPISYIEPYNTSRECSRCGLIGIRDKKTFKCPHCGHVDHADSNASFNIALRGMKQSRSCTDRDVHDGSIDTPNSATCRNDKTENL